MGDVWIIRELEGDQREVALTGATMPARGVDVAGKLRVQSTMYPGASTASVQVMGTEEEPITIQGMLSDVLIGRVGAAAETKIALEDLRLGQRMVQIEWGTDIDARGFVSRTKFRYQSPGRIGFEVEFTVVEHGRAEQIAVAPVVEGEADAEESLEAATLDLDALEGIMVITGDVPAVA